ncbi:MAG: ATP-binding protein [Thermodesulfobacteriota bacterium]
MSLYRHEFPIKEMDFIHAGEASISVKNILKGIGAEPDLIRRVAIASYEAEMNAVMYGREGRMIIELGENGVIVIVEDQGQGISDLELAMREGWSTATPEMREMGFGAGMGLPNIKKNADELRVTSSPGQGTRLEIIFHNVWKSVNGQRKS